MPLKKFRNGCSDTYTAKCSNNIQQMSTKLLAGFQMLSLEHRRMVASLMYLHDIGTGRITWPTTLQKVNLRVPRTGSRTESTFQLSIAPTNILKNRILSRASYLYDRISTKDPRLDVFHLNRKQFSKILMDVLGKDVDNGSTSWANAIKSGRSIAVASSEGQGWERGGESSILRPKSS